MRILTHPPLLDSRAETNKPKTKKAVSKNVFFVIAYLGLRSIKLPPNDAASPQLPKMLSS